MQTSIVITTFSSMEEARDITSKLLEDKLIACGNLVPQVESHYLWKGKVECSLEVQAWYKTKESLVHELMQRIANLHSYENPELIAMPVHHASSAYQNWILESCR